MAIATGDFLIEFSNFSQPQASPPEQQTAMSAAGVIRENGDLVTYGGAIAVNDNLRIMSLSDAATQGLLNHRVRITADPNTGQRGEGTVVGTFTSELPSDANDLTQMVVFVTDAGLYVTVAASAVELAGEAS